MYIIGLNSLRLQNFLVRAPTELNGPGELGAPLFDSFVAKRLVSCLNHDLVVLRSFNVLINVHLASLELRFY